MDANVRPKRGYAPRQRQLHWIVMVAVLVQLLLGCILGIVQPKGHGWILPLHAAIGTTIFLMMLWRWQLRQRLGTPPPPLGTPEPATLAARVNHIGYYILLFAMPIIGWCTFGWGDGFKAAHAAGAILLGLAICAHLCGVGYHTFIRQDGLLQRMAPTKPDGEPPVAEPGV